jgi:hypothetical protein
MAAQEDAKSAPKINGRVQILVGDMAEQTA